MFCQNCGTKNDDAAIFCQECGAKLDKCGTEQPINDEVANPVAPEQKEGQQAGTVNVFNPKIEVANPVALKQKTKISVPVVIVLMEVIAVICIIAAFPFILKNTFSPEKSAELYFVNLVNGDYEKAYQLLDIDENEFINQQSFSNYCKQNNFGKVSNYEVMSSKSKQESGFDYYQEDYAKDSGSGIGKTVTIEYRNKGDESSSTFMVNMIKEAGKKYLFFDDWSTGYSSLVCRNYSIIIKDGAKLILDGVEVSQLYLSTSADYYEGDAVYNIPALFMGTHSVEVTMDGMEPISKTINVSYDDDGIDLGQMCFTEEGIRSLQSLAIENMKKIYGAAAKGKDFSEIASLFTSNEDYLKDIQYNYKNLVDYFQNEEGPVKVVFSNVTAYSDTSETTAEIGFDYVIDYNSRNWWTEKLERGSYSNSGSNEFYFVNEKGNWVMTSIGCSTLYYW